MGHVTRRIQEGALIPCKIPWTFAMTRRENHAPDVDVAHLDEVWEKKWDPSSANSFDKHSILGLLWICFFDVPNIGGLPRIII